MRGFALQRLGQILEPEPGNAHEVEGVLHPAASRGPDGQLYLFPRLVAEGYFSRIVVFPTGIDRRDDLGTPDRIDVYYGMADSRTGVSRLGVPEHLPPGPPADRAEENGLATENADHDPNNQPGLRDED